MPRSTPPARPAADFAVPFANLFASLLFSVLVPLAVATACGGGSGGGGATGSSAAGTNRARFTYDVDLQGLPGTLILDLEVVGNSGVTWGPGVTPEITGVIGTGSATLFTAGELRTPAAYYVFTGENQFADFTEPATSDRFRVQWIETPTGLTMVVNPFGPGPVPYDCVLREARAL